MSAVPPTPGAFSADPSRIDWLRTLEPWESVFLGAVWVDDASQSWSDFWLRYYRNNPSMFAAQRSLWDRIMALAIETVVGRYPSVDRYYDAIGPSLVTIEDELNAAPEDEYGDLAYSAASAGRALGQLDYSAFLFRMDPRNLTTGAGIRPIFYASIYARYGTNAYRSPIDTGDPLPGIDHDQEETATRFVTLPPNRRTLLALIYEITGGAVLPVSLLDIAEIVLGRRRNTGADRWTDDQTARVVIAADLIAERGLEFPGFLDDREVQLILRQGNRARLTPDTRHLNPLPTAPKLSERAVAALFDAKTRGEPNTGKYRGLKAWDDWTRGVILRELQAAGVVNRRLMVTPEGWVWPNLLAPEAPDPAAPLPEIEGQGHLFEMPRPAPAEPKPRTGGGQGRLFNPGPGDAIRRCAADPARGGGACTARERGVCTRKACLLDRVAMANAEIEAIRSRR